MGDYILKEDDILKNVYHEDASFPTTFPNFSIISICVHSYLFVLIFSNICSACF